METNGTRKSWKLSDMYRDEHGKFCHTNLFFRYCVKCFHTIVMDCGSG